jgi:hypothetical protein
VAAWLPDMFCNFYVVKNYKIAKHSTTTKGREKISADLESLEFFDIGFTKFKNNQILPNNISHRFLQTTKLFIWRKSLIALTTCLVVNVSSVTGCRKNIGS